MIRQREFDLDDRVSNKGAATLIVRSSFYSSMAKQLDHDQVVH